jgi:hypothetical protein
MNIKRVLAAGVVAWLVSLPVGYFVNDVLFAGLVTANSAVLRPQAELNAKLPLAFVFLLLAYLTFAYAYAKGYEGGKGLVEGVRFGIITAVMVTGFGLVWQYVMFPITGTLSAAIILDFFVEMSIYGAIVGAIYKPLATARTVAA